MSSLTIPADPTFVEYAIGSAGSAGPFIIPFAYFQTADVKVSWNDGSTTTILTRNSDYTQSDNAASSGGFVSGDIELTPALASGTLRIYRDTVIDRLSNFPLTGPFDIEELNNELNKIIAIAQELEQQRSNFIGVSDDAISTDPINADGRAVEGAGESSDADALATNRQVDASGPNGVSDDDDTTGPLTINQWNTVASISGVTIQGAVTASTKLFDLIIQYFTFLQNQGGSEAECYFRIRYIVDCYSEVVKAASANYRVKIPATSALPISILDIAQDIDYWNGNGTLNAFIDIYPNGSAAASLYTQWNNLLVNTMEPR